jgi:uncharacterized membrane protein YbhN (UPF0104 family)
MAMKKYLKPALAVVILAATVGSFIYYAAKHPEILDKLKHLPPATLLLLLALNVVMFGFYVLVTRASLLLYGKHMGKQENLLFNAYSSLINFFGPGQSGPVFRGAYLKKRHNLGVKQYVFATLMYFGFYGVISVLFAFAGSRPWWQTALACIGAAAGSIVVMKWYRARSRLGNIQWQPRYIGWIGAAAAMQLMTQAAIFAVELHNVGAHASFSQVLSYTGIANLALFVAVTPGSIGIREAFLLFSEKLHHIGSQTIVAANVVDRGVYLVFLGLLFILVITLHAKKKLQVAQLK